MIDINENNYKDYLNDEWWNSLTGEWRNCILRNVLLKLELKCTILKLFVLTETKDTLYKYIFLLEEFCIPEITTKDIVPIKYLINLSELRIYAIHKITDNFTLTGIESLINLKNLYIYDTDLNSLKELKNLIQLTYIHIEYCYALNSLEGIENLINLKYLSISHCNILSLKGIEGCKNLTRFNCHNNRQLYSLKELKSIYNITELSCFNCMITSLEGVENLFNLDRLDCRFNIINSLYPLRNAYNLRYLRMEGRHIHNIEYELEMFRELDYKHLII